MWKWIQNKSPSNVKGIISYVKDEMYKTFPVIIYADTNIRSTIRINIFLSHYIYKFDDDVINILNFFSGTHDRNPGEDYVEK